MKRTASRKQTMQSIPFETTLVDKLPHKTRRSALGVYCPSPVVSAYLCAGDTVQIANESCPSFVGHIIDVSSTISLKAAIHPDALSHPPFLLVQHFITTEERLASSTMKQPSLLLGWLKLLNPIARFGFHPIRWNKSCFSFTK